MLNQELIRPEDLVIGSLKSKIENLEKAIEAFKEYDAERKQYYAGLIDKVAELESYIEELEAKHGIVHIKERLRKSKDANKALQAKIYLSKRFEDMADITAIVAMNKNVLLDKIKEKEKLIKELRSGRDKMLSKIAYLEKQLKLEIKEKIMEEIKNLLEEKNKGYKACMGAYEKAHEEFNDKLMKLLPYEGKLIRIDNVYALGISMYLKVDEVFKHGDKIIIRGYGFKSEFTPYADATYATWDFMQSFEFRLEDIEREVEKIHIIDEVVFNRSFDLMINNMRYRHMQEML